MSIWYIMETLLLAILIGGITGFINRYMRHEGGPRTFALVTLGATLLTMISTYFFINLDIPGAADPGRISAQIVSALSFLAIGMLWLADGKRVRGLSSVANMWVAALIGMMLGAGLTTQAVSAFAVLVGIYLTMSQYIVWRKKRMDKGLKENEENRD